jgi:predicted RNA-binding protein YlxR (DUF448 family)
MTRAGRIKDRQTEERRCVVTGESGAKAGLIRFVVGPDDQIVPDLLERLPGRGIWVRAERGALEAAETRGVMSRAARRKVTVPAGLAGRIEDALAQRVTSLLSLARKAGLAVAGYEKVKGWIDSGQARYLVQARDGSERGKAKLRAPDGPGSLISVLDASELGFAFGRENVIHAALAGGGLTTRVVEEAARLSGLRARNDGETSVGKGNTTA